MDKYKTKNGFCEWFSPIDLKNLSPEAKVAIDELNRYCKKLSFEIILMLLLYAINSDLDSLRHISTDLCLTDLQMEL